jgi:hypothetical protein
MSSGLVRLSTVGLHRLGQTQYSCIQFRPGFLHMSSGSVRLSTVGLGKVRLSTVVFSLGQASYTCLQVQSGTVQLAWVRSGSVHLSLG